MHTGPPFVTAHVTSRVDAVRAVRAWLGAASTVGLSYDSERIPPAKQLRGNQEKTPRKPLRFLSTTTAEELSSAQPLFPRKMSTKAGKNDEPSHYHCIRNSAVEGSPPRVSAPRSSASRAPRHRHRRRWRLRTRFARTTDRRGGGGQSARSAKEENESGAAVKLSFDKCKA